MTGTIDDQRLFWIGYNDDEALFKAYVEVSGDGRIMATEVSRSLEDLLEKCEQNESTETLAGLDRSAIERVHMWLNVERPAIQFVESLWNGSGNPSSRGPIGFRPPSNH